MDDKSERKTVYITKYALSKGIYKADGRYNTESKRFNPDNQFLYLTVGEDCFFTIQEAKTKVIELAKIKKSSIEKQLAKIDAIINGKPVKLRELD